MRKPAKRRKEQCKDAPCSVQGITSWDRNSDRYITQSLQDVAREIAHGLADSQASPTQAGAIICELLEELDDYNYGKPKAHEPTRSFIAMQEIHSVLTERLTTRHWPVSVDEEEDE